MPRKGHFCISFVLYKTYISCIINIEMIIVKVNLECQDGTKILSDESEINALLKEGWSIVESGIVRFNVISDDFDLSPYEKLLIG